MARKNIAIGSYVGTGAAITLEFGFIPGYLRVINITDGDISWDWFDGMTAATAVKTDAAVAAEGSNAVTRNPGVAGTTSAGLTLGTAMSESGKTFRYVAMREST